MNKTIGILVFFSFFFIQKSEGQRFRGAVVAGLNLVQLDGDGLLGFHQAKFQGGIQVYTKLAERWELGVGILYNQQGSKRTATDFPSEFNKIDLNMVEVPVLFHFHEWKFLVNGGFSYSRLINYHILNNKEENVTADYEFNPTLFSILLGVTLNINEHFGVDLQWSKSLNSLYTREDKLEMHSRAVALRGIYFF